MNIYNVIGRLLESQLFWLTLTGVVTLASWELTRLIKNNWFRYSLGVLIPANFIWWEYKFYTWWNTPLSDPIVIHKFLDSFRPDYLYLWIGIAVLFLIPVWVGVLYIRQIEINTRKQL